MVNHTMDDVILLHLAKCEAYEDDPPASYDVSVPGISDVVGVSEGNVSERVSLLSSLSDLKAEGLIRERVAAVATPAEDAGNDERNVYALTPAGRERAAGLRDEVASETVVVRNGTEEEIRLSEADRYFGDDGMVRALSRMTDDGVVYLDEDVGERFVNREDELAELSETMDAVETDGPRFAFVSGEAGIGKTTLVREFEQRAREAGFRFATGRCQSDTTDPYGAFQEALAELDGGRGVARTLTNVSGPDASGDGVDVGTDREAVDARREAMFFEFADGLSSLVAGDPLVVFLDDLQWASPGTLELLEYVAANLGAVPLLVVATYRPEDVPADHRLLATVDAVDDDRRLELSLPRFGHAETRGIVEWLAGTRNVPDEFVAAIQERTGGNPLFVTESVKRLVENGTVDPDLGIYPDDLDETDVPPAVEATIDMRLGALDATSREVLEVGSVVGESIPWRLLAAATDLPEPVVRDRADILVGSMIWEQDSDDAYQFTSAVIRDAVLDRMDDGRRASVHRTVASAIQDAYDDTSEWYASIAEHYEQAGEPRSALEFFRLAGRRAEEVYAHRDAIAHYHRALDLAREVDAEAKALGILEKLGGTYDVSGEYDEAVKHFEYVRDHTDNPATKQRMFAREANVLHTRSEFEDALARVERGLDVDGGDGMERAKLLGLKGWINIRIGEYDAATGLMEEELAFAESLDDEQFLAKAYHDRGAVDLFTNDLESAIEYFERALERWPDGHHKRGDTLNNMGIAYRKLGDLDEAADCYERSLEIAEASNNHRGKSVATSNLSVIYAQQGDLERGIEYGRRAKEMSERIGDVLGVAQALGNLGQHYSDAGRYEEARDAMEQSIDLFEQVGNDNHMAHVCQNLASVYRSLEEYDEAIEYNERGLDLAREVGATDAEVTNLLGIAEAETIEGDPETGLEHATEAASLADELGRPDLILDADLVRGRCLRAVDRYEDAIEYHETALDAARDLGDPRKIANACYELGLSRRDAGDVEGANERLSEATDVAEDHDLDEMAETYGEALDELESA